MPMRSPFVVTVSGLSAVLACSAQVVVDGSGNAGGASSSQSAASNASSSSSGGGYDYLECPPEMPNQYQPCPGEGHPTTCSYDVRCQSGPATVSFSCTPGDSWSLVPNQACSYAYDSCPGTDLYCMGSSWWMPTGTNPPSPCPDPPPVELSECFPYTLGGVHEHCGYPCNGDIAQGWTVASCVGASEPGAWEYDGACAP